jgi:hypothetical protein
MMACPCPLLLLLLLLSSSSFGVRIGDVRLGDVHIGDVRIRCCVVVVGPVLFFVTAI